MKSNKIRLFLFIFLFFLFFESCSKSDNAKSEIPIKKLTVIDNINNKPGIIDDSATLLLLKTLIETSEIQETCPPEPNWSYKIDIESSKYSGRWLYDTVGILTKLNYQLKPSIKIRNNLGFKQIIRIRNRNLRGDF